MNSPGGTVVASSSLEKMIENIIEIYCGKKAWIKKLFENCIRLYAI
mgnify:CR=1 FL=1